MIVDSTQHGHKMNNDSVWGSNCGDEWVISTWSGKLYIEKASIFTLFKKLGYVIFDA